VQHFENSNSAFNSFSHSLLLRFVLAVAILLTALAFPSSLFFSRRTSPKPPWLKDRSTPRLRSSSDISRRIRYVMYLLYSVFIDCRVDILVLNVGLGGHHLHVGVRSRGVSSASFVVSRRCSNRQAQRILAKSGYVGIPVTQGWRLPNHPPLRWLPCLTHGAVKTNGVIHRYIFTPSSWGTPYFSAKFDSWYK
jgi:hypothetical protein